MSTTDDCPRCGAPLRRGYSMSRFNTELICLDCIDEEHDAPGYPAARDAEEAAVRQGDYNFPGVGLSPADHAYLRQRRAERSAT